MEAIWVLGHRITQPLVDLLPKTILSVGKEARRQNSSFGIEAPGKIQPRDNQLQLPVVFSADSHTERQFPDDLRILTLYWKEGSDIFYALLRRNYGNESAIGRNTVGDCLLKYYVLYSLSSNFQKGARPIKLIYRKLGKACARV